MSDPDERTDRPPDQRDATFYRVPIRRRPILGAVLWSLFALVAAGAAATLYPVKLADRALSNPENESVQVKEALKVLDPVLPDQPYNILVIGSDKRPGKAGKGDPGRSDTLILVRLDFKRGFISMLSFPRDLYVSIPGYGQAKINEAYSAGQNKLAVETVKALTGERINYFFNVDFNAFVRLVNDANGVYLDVDRHYLNDNSGAGESFATIDVKPGYQRLRGNDALDYVRYRHFDSDFARIARQQQFLSELKRQSRSARGLDNIVDAIAAEVTTNLKSTKRLTEFLRFGLTTEKERIARVQVKGGLAMRGEASVVIASPKAIADAVDEWKNPFFRSDEAAKPSDPAKVTVTLYNGAQRLGLATKAGEALKAKGYSVTLGGNAPDGFYQSTSVFYAPGKRNDAKAIKSLFGESASIVSRRSGQPQDSDVLVMVGSDFTGRLATPPKAAKTTAKPDTVATTSLAKYVRNARKALGMNLLVPTHVERGSQVVYVNVYNVNTGQKGTPNAITMVFKSPRLSRLGGYSYWTVTQTNLKDPPIIKTRTGVDREGNSTFYNGRTMQRLLWQKGDMTYWISNTLDESLTDVTIRDIRAFMVRPGKASLKKGQTDAAVRIEDRGRTP